MTFFRSAGARKEPQDNRERINRYVVVHPLDDAPEMKVETSGLGLMRMTRSVRISLISLRAYLIVMMLLLLYHVLGLAGLFASRGR
jgi:hypothetical protein